MKNAILALAVSALLSSTAIAHEQGHDAQPLPPEVAEFVTPKASPATSEVAYKAAAKKVANNPLQRTYLIAVGEASAALAALPSDPAYAEKVSKHFEAYLRAASCALMTGLDESDADMNDMTRELENMFKVIEAAVAPMTLAAYGEHLAVFTEVTDALRAEIDLKPCDASLTE